MQVLRGGRGSMVDRRLSGSLAQKTRKVLRLAFEYACLVTGDYRMMNPAVRARLLLASEAMGS